MPTSHLGSRCMSKHITQSKSRLFFGSLADITARSRHVCFTPDSGHSSVQVRCPLSAMSGELFLVVADTANLISDLISTIGSGL